MMNNINIFEEFQAKIEEKIRENNLQVETLILKRKSVLQESKTKEQNENEIKIETFDCELNVKPVVSWDQFILEISKISIGEEIEINKNKNVSNQIIDKSIENGPQKESKVKLSTLDKLEAIKRYEKGETLKSISCDLKVAQSNILYWYKTKEKLENSYTKTLENSIEKNFFNNIEEEVIKKPFTPPKLKASIFEKVEAIKKHENGETLTKIAEDLNTPISTILYWIRNKEKLLIQMSNNRVFDKIKLKR